MKPLIVLISTFIISMFIIRLVYQKQNLFLSARIAMCLMLFFTSIGHFVFTKGMTMMIPNFIPFKIQIIYTTGFLEIPLGISLLFPGLRFYAGWAVILFFILMLPANIKAAMTQLNFERETFDKNGLAYLWFRIPLQIFFMLWTYLSTIKYQ